MSAIPVQLAKGILRSGVSGFRCLAHPNYRLCRITDAGFQTHLTQQILCIDISKLRRFLQIGNRRLHILVRTGSGVEHLTEAVLQPIIMAFLFQTIKPGKGRLEMLGGKFRAHCGTNAIPIHLRQFIIRIRVALCGRQTVELQRFYIILRNTLTTVIQRAERILGILVVLIHRFLKP